MIAITFFPSFSHYLNKDLANVNAVALIKDRLDSKGGPYLRCPHITEFNKHFWWNRADMVELPIATGPLCIEIDWPAYFTVFGDSELDTNTCDIFTTSQ